MLIALANNLSHDALKCLMEKKFVYNLLVAHNINAGILFLNIKKCI